MKTDYDVIIAGGRVAGASLAYELGKAGYEVLLLDKGRIASDVLSTHNFFNNSVAMLREMGVLDKLLATGTPTYKHAYIQFGEAIIAGEFPEANGESECLCIRRPYLDRILFEHAASLDNVTAVQQLRVTEVIQEGDAVRGVKAVDADGQIKSFGSRLVVGADGRRSTVRELVGSKRLTAVPTDFASYVGYFSGLKQPGERCVEFYKQGEHLAIVFPTSDGLHVVGLMFPLEWSYQLQHMTRKPEAAFRDMIKRGFAGTSLDSRLEEANLTGPIRGLQGYDNDWHEGMGNGWALTGDALSFKDPAVGQGMHDALYGAKVLRELLSSHADWSKEWQSMARQYESRMNEKTKPLFELACSMTKNVPITPEQTAVNWMIGIHPEATSAFLGMYNHTSTPAHLESVIGAILRGERSSKGV